MSEDYQKYLDRRAPNATELADRYAIGQLVKIYALGIDMRDFNLLMSAFDPEGVGEGITKRMRLADYLAEVYAGAAAFKVTQHTISNQYISIIGNEAEMLSYGVAYHIREKDDPDGNLIVGVHYRDVCRRGETGWLITGRKAAMQWIEGNLPRKKS